MTRASKTAAGLAAVAAALGIWFAVARRPEYSRPVRVGVDHSPPYYLVQPDGGVKGLAVDVLNEAARRRGIRLVWTPLHDIPLEDALDRRVVDMWPLVGTTPERRKKFYLSKPWLESEYVLASLREHPVRNPAEAAGKTVAHARLHFTGLIARQYLSRSRELIKVYRDQAIQAVCNGEAAAVLVESHVLDAIMLTRPQGCENANFQVAALSGAATPLSIAAVPEAARAAKALRDEITNMSKDGYLSAKLDEWSPFSAQGQRSVWAEDAANQRSLFYSYCLALILLFSSVLAWVAYRAWSLKKAAEKAEIGRREIQRRFTAFMDHSPTISFMKDAAGRLLYANKAWGAAFGTGPEAAYGKSDFDLWPSEVARQLSETDRDLLARGAPRQLIESIPVSRTESRDFLVVKFPFSSESGEKFVGGIAVDITEREAAVRAMEASEARYRELFEHNPLPAWVYDRDSLAFLNVNRAAIGHYGWTREDFLSGMTVRDLLAPGPSGRRRATDADLATPRSSAHVTKHGQTLSVDVTSYELDYEGRSARLMIVRDITEQERTIEALRVSEERWQLALRAAGDALWDWDIVSGRVFRSARWAAMLGYEESEIGDTREDFLRLLHFDDAEATESAIHAHLSGLKPSFSAEYRLRHKDGSWRWIMDRGQAVWDRQGKPVRMAGSHTDITDRRAAEDLLAIQARTDALTGVANRREFERIFKCQFEEAQARRQPLSVCICDLDHFKEVNDYYGHAAGDRVLIAFASILRGNLTGSDAVARIGGDEFVLALPGSTAEQACEIMDRVRGELASTVFQGAAGIGFEVTSSFGIAGMRGAHANCDDLMAEADRCLYEAKAKGRDCTMAA